jgi:hypothetical protein
MNGDNNAAPESANGEQETTLGIGELDKRSEEFGGESEAAQEETKGEPSGEGLFDGMTPEKLHESYKNLQREFGKNSEEFKQVRRELDRMGGVEQVAQWFDYLSNNPNFNKFIESEQKRNVYGINMDELDEDGKRAMDLVTKIANQVADEKVKAALKNSVDPLSETVRERVVSEHFSKMDSKYPDWREMQNTMAELAEDLPKKTQNNPAFKDVESLYLRAIVETGSLDSVAAKMHAKKLESKRAQTTEKPADSTQKGKRPQPKTILEAFEQAKSQKAG